MDVTPIAAEVGGFQAHRDVVAFLPKLDVNLDGITRIAPPFRGSEKRRWLRIGEFHGRSGLMIGDLGARDQDGRHSAALGGTG